ncbi:hypothetical protein [Mucilaginibacter paludis]|uniref:Uncharacterized protein n=1 Tax=Mucilaginibacter paludis DSM 18603 TaxID=714943 RepID=H1Y2D5_9SPHI|nr:hypothetical protein [Mucilaginibacter paludis]EHQ27915.1 hypothetical protein Mucpa_3819 [Mucilaginibacter paludis DSM 18603]
MQIAAGKISYYCFNSNCKSSVFYLRTTKVTDLPFEVNLLTEKHSCEACGHELTSLLNIEIKKAFLDAFLGI